MQQRSSPQISADVAIRSVTSRDGEAISALHAHVFGPGRFTRTAYRVREGKGLLSPYCRLAERGGKLVASLRLTDIAIGGTSGAVLLGPLAVDPEFRGHGIGSRLIAESLADMKRAGVKLVILVGDLAYYGRFGFKSVPPAQIVVPGPVDPQRILALELSEASLASYRGVIAAVTPEPATPPGASGKG
jgi:predicted N-acetyltransferase YhbS